MGRITAVHAVVDDDDDDTEDFLTAGTRPMSAILTRPWLSQHEKLILNLRGRFWHIGLRNKNLAIALEYGVASNASLGHTPAKWLHITFLTEFPHASLVVRPTSTKPLMTSLTSSS